MKIVMALKAAVVALATAITVFVAPMNHTHMDKHDCVSKMTALAANDRNGYHALHFAIRECVPDCVKQLLELDMNVDVRSTRIQHTPPMIAASENQVVCLDILMNAGADFNATDNHGMTVVHHAAMKGNLEALKFLIGHGQDFDAMDNTGRLAVHYAASGGSLKALNFLIEQGHNLSAMSSNGETTVHGAAGRGHLDVLKFLVEQGVDLDTHEIFGESVVHLAARGGYLDVLKYLAEQGKSMLLPNSRGYTPLQLAWMRRRSWTVYWLEEYIRLHDTEL